MKNLKVCASVFAVYVFLFSSGVGAGAQVESAVLPASQPGKISLDLKGMDVVEVLKILATKNNMNMVIGANVRGRVTMFLKDVDAKEAFELILVSNALAADFRGGITYIMTDREYQQLYGETYADKKVAKIIPLKYAKAAEVEKLLTKTKTTIGKIITDEASNTLVVIDAPDAVAQALEFVETIDKPTKTAVFELDYAVAADMKAKIQDMLTPAVGAMQFDERTNKIVVTDLEGKIEQLKAVLKAFDSKQKQVLIDSKIVEITLDDKYKLGVDWQAVLTHLQKQLTIKNSFQLATQGGLVPGAEVVVGTFTSGEYALMVQMLKTVGDTNVLSSPRITVLNNQEAKILVGSSQPYATNSVTQGTATTTTATNLTFIDVGIKLFVTPTINKDGYVSVRIRPEVSSKSGDYTYGTPATTVPIISTTQAETTVSIKDGTTIIIAGLITDTRSSTVDKVPFFGDLPLLGLAFKKTVNEIQKKELVIFITPHIVSGENDYTKNPKSMPPGEDKFTMPEKPTFERRTPVQADATYMDKKKVARIAASEAEHFNPSSPEAYFDDIKSRVSKSVSISKKTSGVKPGDRVVVGFLVSSGGDLLSVPEVLDSSNDIMSAAVVTAIEKTAPFPAFPSSIKDAQRNFVIELVYKPEEERKGFARWISKK